jgi:heme oxygenase (biliverdin-IX-beta and delta-forming)
MPTVAVAPSLHQRLRDATASAHARLDALASGGFAHEADYRAYLGGMHRFLATLLPALRDAASALRWRLPDWSGLLARDLAHVGAATTPTATLPPLPRASALGALYVVEGASLGARVLLRQAHALGHDADGGAAFLHAHAGNEDRRRWPRFLALLAEADGDDADAACASAVEAFGLAERSLRAARGETA